MTKNKKVCVIIFSSVPPKDGGIIFWGLQWGLQKSQKFSTTAKIHRAD